MHEQRGRSGFDVEQLPDVGSLPIARHLEEIRRSLRTERSLILRAEPGAGKSTVVPIALLGEPWLGDKRILLLQPRRVAARTIASRMADLIGEPVGQTIGYAVRFERVVSERTRVEVVTEGLLVRRMQDDLALSGIGAIILDEFHERSIYADLSFAMLTEVQELRPDLRLILMSATLDDAPIRAVQPHAVLIEVPGRQHPVTIEHVSEQRQEPVAAQAAQEISRVTRVRDGDLLAFLPGLAEIQATARLLESERDRFDVLPLYGDQPLSEQRRTVRPAADARRRVVLATPIAETSLTVDRLAIVVDSGLRRAVRYDPAFGLDRVKTERITRDAAEQRAGRAGRLRPGWCVRLWTVGAHGAMRDRRAPEIEEVDLAPLVLELACWGAHEPGALRWVTPPPSAGISAARRVLRGLGAIDHSGRPTARGREIARLPVHPRLAALIVDAADRGSRDLGCDLAALLTERDPFPSDSRPGTDIELRVQALDAFRSGERPDRMSADRRSLERIDRAASQLRRLRGHSRGSAGRPTGSVGSLLASAYPERVARRRQAADAKTGSRSLVRYLLATGTAVTVEAADPLSRSEWLVIPHLGLRSDDAVAYLAASLSDEDVQAILRARAETQTSVRYDPDAESVRAEEVVSLGSIVVERRPLTRPPDEQVVPVLLDAIRAKGGAASLPWPESARALRSRALAVRRYMPELGAPDLSDEALTATFSTWLAPLLGRRVRMKDVETLDLLEAIRAQIPWNVRDAIEREAPRDIELPNGRRRSLEYSASDGAMLPATVQELLGWRRSPVIGSGRIPLTFQILSPARRPVQVTRDLEGFWQGSYAAVRKELRGRYPKHDWPEDPLTFVRKPR